MRTYWFPDRKGGIFRPGKEIKGLRGGVLLYAAQARPRIDTARTEKNPFRRETRYWPEPTTRKAMAHIGLLVLCGFVNYC